MAEKSERQTSIDLEKVGERQVELFRARIELSEEDRQRAKRDPEKLIEELLSRAGQRVNSVKVGTNFSGDDECTICDYVHVQSPPEERSNWELVNCEPLPC